MSVPKIPTLISYDEAKLSDFRWGALVEDLSAAIVGIKLLLDPSQKRPAYLHLFMACISQLRQCHGHKARHWDHGQPVLPVGYNLLY